MKTGTRVAVHREHFVSMSRFPFLSNLDILCYERNATVQLPVPFLYVPQRNPSECYILKLYRPRV